ncbi:MAG: 50S ribosomal protein L20 [Chitinispirillaceae bacterium]|nr:50S ribosomal protein L20 [Chitinispirillaceae bacterium]
MPRAKSRVASRARRKKLLKKTAGQFGKRKSSFAIAKDAFYRGGVYAYRDRRARKRSFRALWIIRINAAARAHGLTYSRFMSGLKKKNVALDRKALAHLAMHEPAAINKLIELVKS